MSQTAYNQRPSAAFPGVFADMQEHNVISRKHVGAAAIVFGTAVKRSAGVDLCDNVDGAGNLILGLAVHEHNENGNYQPDDLVSIMQNGVMWVLSDDSVVEGGLVYVKHSNGTLLAADDGANSSLLEGARWASTRTGAGLVKVRLGGIVGALS